MSSAPQANDEEEEDYMSMTIVEPTKPSGAKETYTQRRLRKQREVCSIFLVYDQSNLTHAIPFPYAILFSPFSNCLGVDPLILFG